MKTTMKSIVFIAMALALTGCATQATTTKEPETVELKFIPKDSNIAQFNADVKQCRKETAKRFGDMLAGAPDSAMMSDCMTVQMGHKVAKQ